MVNTQRIIELPQIEIMLNLANRNVIELPPLGIIPTATKPRDVLRRPMLTFEHGY